MSSTTNEFPELWRVSLKCCTVYDLSLESALERAFRIARVTKESGECAGLLAAMREFKK